MILYTTTTCPRCNVVKVKMNQANLSYEVSTDIEQMEKLKIKQVPMLQLDDGTLLDFSGIINYLKEVQG